MQPIQKLEQKTIQEMLDVHLALLTTNIEAWAELLAEDSVVEFPYAAVIAPMQNLTFTIIPFTGRQYQQDYAMRLKTRDGKLVYYSEF
jgi:uncharacterized protein